MMLTEEEAKTKRCPSPSMQQIPQYALANASVMGFGIAAAQASLSSPHPINIQPWLCQGSACMAWRWQDAASMACDNSTTINGYCGMAGKP